MRLGVKTTTVLVFGIFSAISLNAGTIGPDCGSCFGSTYTLNVSFLSSDSVKGTTTYKVDYTVDATGFTGPSPMYIGSLAVKLSSSKVTADSTVSTNAPGTWTPLTGNVNNSGCGGSGSGWVCIQGSPNEAMVGNLETSPYTWEFTVTMATGSLLSTASVQANYDPANGYITSETVSMPEGTPAELPLAIAGGMAWLGFRRCRK